MAIFASVSPATIVYVVDHRCRRAAAPRRRPAVVALTGTVVPQRDQRRPALRTDRPSASDPPQSASPGSATPAARRHRLRRDHMARRPCRPARRNRRRQLHAPASTRPFAAAGRRHRRHRHRASTCWRYPHPPAAAPSAPSPPRHRRPLFRSPRYSESSTPISTITPSPVNIPIFASRVILDTPAQSSNHLPSLANRFLQNFNLKSQISKFQISNLNPSVSIRVHSWLIPSCMPCG